MSWTIERTDRFLKTVKKHRKNHVLLQQLDKKLQRLKDNPHAVGGSLGGSLAGKKSTRLAKKYRLIFSIDEEEETVYLVALGHREGVY